ncbi:MAG: hypothetical protein IPK50_22195 [Fibrobacterota bacterium]|nr:hypothetical protein [Fibrobacterota bacterium]QQS04957.1 MAG: hypothetical protein IPK50_22195 [Fibrobacterota bacterium]
MFRSNLSLLAIATLAISAFAQKTESPVDHATEAVVGTRQGQQVNLKDIEVKGVRSTPNAFGIIDDGSVSPLASIDLSRDLLVAVQGNVDREHMERQNGESR